MWRSVRTGTTTESSGATSYRARRSATSCWKTMPHPVLHQPGRLLNDIDLAAEAPQSNSVEQPAERAADHHHLRGHAVLVQHDDIPPGPILQTLPLSPGIAAACSKASRMALGPWHRTEPARR